MLLPHYRALSSRGALGLIIRVVSLTTQSPLKTPWRKHTPHCGASKSIPGWNPWGWCYKMRKWVLSFFILRFRQQKHVIQPHKTRPHAKPSSASPRQMLKSNNRNSRRERGLLLLQIFSWFYWVTSLDLKFLCLQSTRPPIWSWLPFFKAFWLTQGFIRVVE